MQKHFFIIFLFFSWNTINSQELNCTVTVNSSQITGSNKQVFKTLEKSISDFINQTKWTDTSYESPEKIQCSLQLNITEKSSSKNFKGTIQIHVSRPIYNSTYQSPLLNYQDTDVAFTYEEFQTLVFNESTYESNLTSLLSFYAYLIIGIDSDSFVLNGGNTYYKTAEKIIATAAQGGYKGWNSLDKNQSRYKIIEELLNDSYQNYRSLLYNYHLKGLDTMYKDPKKAKETIQKAIISLRSIYAKKPSSNLLRIFLETKFDEIESIFKSGPMTNTADLREMLQIVYPLNSKNWQNIK